MGKSATKLPTPLPLSMLDAIDDPNLRKILQAVTEGWYIRNGIRGSAKEIEFITIDDINNDPDLRRRLRAALGIV